jgi:hypothetical protein
MKVCKIPACWRRVTKPCKTCGLPVCPYHAITWGEYPVCAKCRRDRIFITAPKGTQLMRYLITYECRLGDDGKAYGIPNHDGELRIRSDRMVRSDAIDLIYSHHRMRNEECSHVTVRSIKREDPTNKLATHDRIFITTPKGRPHAATERWH